MDVLDETEALSGLEKLTAAVMDVQKFSIYLLEGNTLHVRTTYGHDHMNSEQ